MQHTIILATQNFFLTLFLFVFLVLRDTQPETSKDTHHLKQWSRFIPLVIVSCPHTGAELSMFSIETLLSIFLHLLTQLM